MTHLTCHSSAVTAGRLVINPSVSRWHDWLLTVCTSLWRKSCRTAVIKCHQGKVAQTLANAVHLPCVMKLKNDFKSCICLVTTHCSTFLSEKLFWEMTAIDQCITPSLSAFSCSCVLISLLLLSKEKSFQCAIFYLQTLCREIGEPQTTSCKLCDKL